MKYINFLFAVIMSSVACMFTSCYENNIPVLINNLEEDLNSAKNDTITVSADLSKDYYFTVRTNNVNAEIKLKKNDETKYRTCTEGSEYTDHATKGSVLYFEVIGRDKDHSATPIQKEVHLDSNGKIIYIHIPENSVEVYNDTIKKDAELSEYVTLVNSTDNQKSIFTSGNVKATMKIKSSDIKAMSASNAKKCAITVENAIIKDVPLISFANASNQEFWLDVINVKCSDVTKAINGDITIENKFFTKGMKVRIDNKEQTLEKDKIITIKDCKLGKHTISVNFNVKLITEKDTMTRKNRFDIPFGNTELKYETRTGYSSVIESNEIINMAYEQVFGKPSTIEKQSIRIQNNVSKARLDYIVYQKVYKYNVTFGNISTEVSVFGEDWLINLLDRGPISAEGNKAVIVK